jgi:hypothetical protein
VKTVADMLGVSRSNLVEQLKGGAKHRRLRSAKRFGAVDGAAVGERRDRPDPRHRHESSTDWVDPSQSKRLPVQLGKLLRNVACAVKQPVDEG